MRTIDVKELPDFNVTPRDIREAYEMVYLFIMDLKNRKGKDVSKRYRSAVENPAWAATEIVYLALYGYTKKIKFSKQAQYLKWNKLPKTFHSRVLMLLGPPGKTYFQRLEDEKRQIKEDKKIDPTLLNDPEIDMISYELRVDNVEVSRRMQRYIKDFDLHSAIDIDILKNLVQTQILIEQEHKRQLAGRPPQLDLKSLSMQVKDYVSVLGLSKKDRIDFGAERKRGSIAELAFVYEQTLEEFTDLEEEFLIEELEMLLSKYERRNEDGIREVSAKEFQVWSGGFSVEEARELVKKKADYGRD